jgi:hypothetical protein
MLSSMSLETILNLVNGTDKERERVLRFSERISYMLSCLWGDAFATCYFQNLPAGVFHNNNMTKPVQYQHETEQLSETLLQ